MEAAGVFPFGRPVVPVVQADRSPKRVFVLGDHGGGVFARWFGPDGHLKIGGVAVAPEPEVLWRGSRGVAAEIVAGIGLPHAAGRLEPAGDQLNGPAGAALDELLLRPLGLSREDAWLCDLVPHSCITDKQAAALRREYDPVRLSLGLPAYDWPRLPRVVADAQRCAEVERELLDSGADLLITLGDVPIRWFAERYGAEAGLSSYGRADLEYGRPHPLVVAGRSLTLLPLIHPRQAAGGHSSGWFGVHRRWAAAPPMPATMA